MAIGGYPTSYILGNTQTVSIGTSSAQSSAVSGKLNVYRIIGSCDSHIAIGVNPTATTSSAMLPAYTIEYIVIPEGEKVAVLKFATQNGTMYITECTR
tara:strand:- start:3011 stop:3304 length:294 start_codon:yes stop_codon:yes gene_type:complete